MTNDGGQQSEPTSYGLQPPRTPPAQPPYGAASAAQDPGGGDAAYGQDPAHGRQDRNPAYDPNAAQGPGQGYEPTQASGYGAGAADGTGRPPGVPPQGTPGVPRNAPATPDGRVIGDRYELVSRLGHGGMGTVWLGRDLTVKREVAVKEPRLPDHLGPAERDRAYQRMEREAQAAARIDHPSVVTMHDVVLHDGKPWVVMELVRGQSLADRLQEGTLDPREAARVGLAVVGALQAAHDAGVLHRDVKPDNVLLGRDGRVVLTDFGIAQVEGEQRLTETGAFVGSPEFTAPERVLGQRPGPASDLWSLGVVLYTAVEGVSPFRRSNSQATLQAVLSAEPQSPSRAPGELALLIMQLLRKDPMTRPHAADVRRSLEALTLQAAPTRLYPPSGGTAVTNRWVPPVLQTSRAARWGLGAGVVVVACALLLVLANPFGGNGLPSGWENRPEDEVHATLATPPHYTRTQDADNGTNVTFSDESDVFTIYLEEVDNSQSDSYGSSDPISPKADAWKKFYDSGGQDGTEVDSDSARTTTKDTTFQGHKAIDLYVTWDHSNDISGDDTTKLAKHELIIPRGGNSKVYWRLEVDMPAEGWAHAPGEDLYHTVLDHLEIKTL